MVDKSFIDWRYLLWFLITGFNNFNKKDYMIEFI